jgi:hypothetical protein
MFHQSSIFTLVDASHTQYNISDCQKFEIVKKNFDTFHIQCTSLYEVYQAQSGRMDDDEEGRTSSANFRKENI